MRIQVSTVKRIAYATRTDMLKQEPVVALNYQPVSNQPLPRLEGRCGVGWRAYSPIPANIEIHQAISAMPLIVGRERRDHRVITANPAPRIHQKPYPAFRVTGVVYPARRGGTYVCHDADKSESHITKKSLRNHRNGEVAR